MPIPRKDKTPLWQTLIAPEAVAEIHRQLYQGVRPGALARKVQGSDPPLFPRHTVRQVKDWLYLYHRKTVQPEWSKAVLGAAHASRRDKLIQRLDVVVELEDLAVKLRARFDRFFAHESRLVDPEGAPLVLAGIVDAAKQYRATLVAVARVHLESGLMHRVPQKVESPLVTAMAGRSVFEFTPEDVARFERASLIQGMTRESIGLVEAGAEAPEDCDSGTDDC